jgi:hypothetical protein
MYREVGPASPPGGDRPVGGAGPAVSPDTLLAIADACRRHEWRTFRVDRLTPRSPTGWTITSVDTAFALTSGPPELGEALHAQATRCLRAIGAP